MAKRIDLSLAIPAEEYLRLYQGNVKSVSAVSTEGKRIQFPAEILRPYVLHDGVYGYFSIFFDDDFRFKRIEKLST